MIEMPAPDTGSGCLKRYITPNIVIYYYTIIYYYYNKYLEKQHVYSFGSRINSVVTFTSSSVSWFNGQMVWDYITGDIGQFKFTLYKKKVVQ